MKTKIKLNTYSIAVIAVWCIAVLAIILGQVTLRMPQQKKLAQLRNQYRESREQAEHAQMAAVPESLNRLQNQREHSKQLIDTFSTPRDNITGLVFEIGQLANDSGLSEFSSKSQDNGVRSTIDKSKLLTENWLTVEFESSFQEFVRYVNKLERNQPVVFVESLLFRRSTNNPGVHRIKLDLSFLTHTENAGHSLASATSP